MRVSVLVPTYNRPALLQETLESLTRQTMAPGLFEAELRYLHAHEWARSADDVLWRRSKLGLHMDAAQRAAVAGWCAANWGDFIAGETAAAASISDGHSETTWN